MKKCSPNFHGLLKNLVMSFEEEKRILIKISSLRYRLKFYSGGGGIQSHAWIFIPDTVRRQTEGKKRVNRRQDPVLISIMALMLSNIQLENRRECCPSNIVTIYSMMERENNISIFTLQTLRAKV